MSRAVLVTIAVVSAALSAVLALLGWHLAAYGWYGMADGLRYREAEPIAIRQFLAEAPTAGWYVIGGARYDAREIVAAGRTTQRGAPMSNGYYLPIYASADASTPSQRIALVAHLDAEPSAGESLSIRGAIEHPAQARGFEPAELRRAFGARLDADYRVIEVGKGPPLVAGTFFFLVGAFVLIFDALLLVAVARIARRRGAA